MNVSRTLDRKPRTIEEVEADRDRHRHIRRLGTLAEMNRRQAAQLRHADNTARGEKAAENAELNERAIRWALAQLDPPVTGLTNAELPREGAE